MRVALNPRIRAETNRLLLVSPGRGAKFPPARFSWSPAGPARDRVWRARGRTDVPKIVDWYMDGRIEIDPMITSPIFG